MNAGVDCPLTLRESLTHTEMHRHTHTHQQGNQRNQGNQRTYIQAVCLPGLTNNLCKGVHVGLELQIFSLQAVQALLEASPLMVQILPKSQAQS